MTMICAMGANGFFGAVADVLLTSSEPTDGIHLPLHREEQRRTGPLGHIGALAQKMVIIGGRTLVLWAGPLIDAQRVMKRIQVVSDEGISRIDLKAVCADLEIDPKKIGLSLIYCFIDGDEVYFDSLNARGRSEPPFYFAGSGAQHFLDHLSPVVAEAIGEQQNPFWNVFIPRILFAQINEAVEGAVFGHHYGGWYEIVEIVDGVFRKQTLCLKFWEKNRDALTTWSPLWFSLYNGEDLHVARVITLERGHEKADLEIEVSVIPSILHPPTPEPDLSDLRCACSVEFHVIVERETGKVRSLIAYGMQPDDRFQWLRTPDGAQIRLSPAVQKALERTVARFSLPS